MKKKKLSLEELKVQSFITELKPDHAQTAKGGTDSSVIATVVISVIDTIAGTIQTYVQTQDESWWNCRTYGVGDEKASEQVDEYGCMLPTITICG